MENKTTSPGLDWIVSQRQILNVRRLEEQLGMPNASISKFLETGYFPKKRIAELDTKIQQLTSNESVTLMNYITSTLQAWKKSVKDMRAKPIKVHKQRNLEQELDNARQEQMLDDLHRLQEILRRTNPVMAGFLHTQAKQYVGKMIADILLNPKTVPNFTPIKVKKAA